MIIVRAPPPNTYDLPSDFQKGGKKGPQFGLGRKEVSKAYLKTAPPFGNGAPGPGAYNTIKAPGKDTPKFTMRAWTADPTLISTSKTVPGPGTYPIMSSINEKGNFMWSKYRGSAATLFNPKTSVRFKKLRI